MTREKAISKIITDLNNPLVTEDFVLQTIGRLGCGQTLDLQTVSAVEQVIRNEFRVALW